METRPKKLDLGCGPGATTDGWIHLDGSWNAWLSKHRMLRRLSKVCRVVPASLLETVWSSNVVVHDVRRGLPFASNSLEAIYASHLLEHLHLVEAKRLLSECHRVLLPAGVLRVVVPDLRAIVMQYVNDVDQTAAALAADAMSAADKLNHALLFRRPEPPPRNIVLRLYAAFGDFHSHKWMYDSDSLIRYLKQAGLVSVCERKFHDSQIEGIANIEAAERVLNGAGICVEGVKPS